MLNYKAFCILFILVFPLVSFAQNTPRKELSGKLLPSKEKMFLETIYVYNKQSGKGILSDSLGNFKLHLRQGDTVAISAMHIEPKELAIEKMHLNDAFVTLSIKPSIEYLTEVRLSNRSLTGNLDLDMKRLALEPVITSSDLGFPVSSHDMTTGERMLNSYTSSPTELLFAALTGELKKVKRRIAIEKREGKIQYISKRMPSTFYTSNLNLAQQNIPHFLEFCESKNDLDYLANISIDEFIEALERYAVLYRESFPERF